VRLPKWTLAIVAILVLSTVHFAAASVLETQKVPAVKSKSAPPADASLSDPIWESAIKATDFVNATAQAPAKLATTAYLLYDDKNLYVGFICDQHGVPITASQTVNDVGMGLDDSVMIAIETSGSGTRVYTFSATPRGVRYETSSESSRYNPPWQAVTMQADGSYRVMMTIPLADLRVQNAKVQDWRVNFTRRIASTGDLYTWVYNSNAIGYCTNNSAGFMTYCDAPHWPVIAGLEIAGTNARPKPYADIYGLGSTGSQRTTFETTPGNFTTQNPRAIGVDVTVPFTSSLAFVGTLAPDFSNVEADQTTISPQEFARNFQEYRPFFAQGSQYIDALPHVNINGQSSSPFYSPAIGIFDSGFKIEGTAGRNAIGLLTVHGDGFNDQAFGYGNARPDGSLSISAEGVLVNHNGLIDNTFGFGGGFTNLKSGMQSVAVVQQESGTLVTTSSLAQSVVLGQIVQHGPFLAGVVYREAGPEFAPVDGFIRINDIHGPQGVFVYNGVGSKGSAIKSYSFSAVADRYLDGSGAVHEADTSFGGSILFNNLLALSFGSNISELRSYDSAYPVYLNPVTNVFNQVAFAAGYKDGTPAPIDASYSYGPFAVFCPGVDPQPLLCANTAANLFTPAFVQQLDISTSRTFGHGFGISAEYGGTIEHGTGLPEDSEWLRRISLTRAFGAEGQLAVGIRSINGTGGFAIPATNIAVSYHQRMHDGSQLYFEYGTPAAASTLQRVVIKYVLHLGGAGT
jgi:hypothetical protein